MSRIQPADESQIVKKTADMLGNVKAKMGRVPNILRTMAHSPGALGAYLGMSSALNDSSLSPQVREQIALAVAKVNECKYCNAAHTFIAGTLDLDDQTIEASRKAQSDDPKVQAILNLAVAIIESRGFVSDELLQKTRDAGVTENELVDTVASTVLNIYTNYFNHIADTEIDFPKVD